MKYVLVSLVSGMIGVIAGIGLTVIGLVGLRQNDNDINELVDGIL